jgi:hypothetical protein
MKAGIYGEYNLYREQYQQWRRGEPRGATTRSDAYLQKQREEDPFKFDYWYPSASIFKWRFTTAYWSAIFYLCGSLLFTFDAGICYFNGRGGKPMQTWPNGFGAVFFTLGAYFGYLQMINVATDKEESVSYLVPDCFKLCGRAGGASIIGSLGYFLGACSFNVGAFTALGEPEPGSRFWFVDMANVVGSIGFVIAGTCEVVHNRIFTDGATSAEPVWWATMANFVGGMNFLLASAPGVLFPLWHGQGMRNWVNGNYLLGSALFIVSSCLMIVMWRANDFGLTLLKQLNFAVRAGGQILGECLSPRGTGYVGVRLPRPNPEEPQPLEEPIIRSASQSHSAFSSRGVFFIVLYCYFACVALINCICKHLWYVRDANFHSNLLQHIIDLGLQIFMTCMVALVLVVHSVVTEVPDEQPFFCALVSTRALFFCGAVLQTITLVQFMFSPSSYEVMPSLLSLIL